MLRTGRFRHRLLDDSFLINTSPQAFQSLSVFFDLWQQGRLSDAEISAVYLTVFSFLRRPQDFLGGAHNKVAAISFRSEFTSRHFVTLLRSTLPEKWQTHRSLLRFENDEAFLAYVCAQSFRSIPLSVMRSLSSWAAGTYPLRLMTSIPSPAEVLALQTQGCRCVTMLIQESEMKQLVSDGRDALGFLVHDLIHADHFFIDQEGAQAQVMFSRKLQELWQTSFLQDLIRLDSAFEAEFHYLMSDMNSVPLHLLKTLKSQLLAHVKRMASLEISTPLPEHLESHFHSLFKTALLPWNFSSAALEAAHRLNTVHYSHPDDSYILHQEMTCS